jgi:hypothetical protein
MKKSILLSLLLMLSFSFTAFAQDEGDDGEAIEELSEVPSLDELLERPKDIKVESIDKFKNASFDLYDKVIETRKAGESDGWPDQGVKVASFYKEYFGLVKATVIMAKDIKSVPKLKLIFATKNFIASKRAISHSSAHIRYMKEQFTAEQWAEYEGMLAADEGEESTEEPADDGDGK